MDQWPFFAFSSGKFVWTNGTENSSKVSPDTGIVMVLPSLSQNDYKINSFWVSERNNCVIVGGCNVWNFRSFPG